MIMPKYKASGSGWWRARYCHAVKCHNVIYADQKEVNGIDPEFWMSIQDIEALSKNKLHELQLFQEATLCERMPKWLDVVDNINEIVRDVKKRKG